MQASAPFLRCLPLSADKGAGGEPSRSVEQRGQCSGAHRGGGSLSCRGWTIPPTSRLVTPLATLRTTASRAGLALFLGLALASTSVVAEVLGTDLGTGVRANGVATPLHDLPRLGGDAHGHRVGLVDGSASPRAAESGRERSAQGARVGAGTDGAGQQPSASAELLEQAAAGLRLFSPRLLTTFYRQRGYRPAWSPAQAEAMVDLAAGSRWHGLAPSEFHLDALRELDARAALPAEAARDQAGWRAELLLSDALLRYLHHLQYGQFNPRQINPDWTFVDSIDAALLTAEMHAVIAAVDLSAAVDEILPRAPFYEDLKRGYQRYLTLADTPGGDRLLTAIPPGANLKIGMRDPRVPAIRDRFEWLDGYRFGATPDPDIYDRALYEAVLEFQERSGLAQDGVIGPRTLAVLNRPFRERLAVMRANLERMRWLYHALPDDYLLVDIAAFQLQLMRGQEPVWSTRTIVGTREDQTPMFRDEIEHLVFNPTWSVPPSIQKEMRSVPSGYRVIDRRTGRRVYPSNPTDWRRYRLVQSAGPKNALGRVKFMFPNGHAIYLHDTPSRHLFARPERAYSHGCVRVDNPLELARELLDAPGWQADEIERVLGRGQTRYVNLDGHLPVLLYYITARADEKGRVGFRPDIYERDVQLLAAMEQPASAARIVFSDKPEPIAEAPAAEVPSLSGAARDGGAREGDGLQGLPNDASSRTPSRAMQLASTPRDGADR